MVRTLFPPLVLLLGACQPGGEAGVPGDRSDHRPFAEISAEEVLQLTGTEPFWGGEISGGTLTYTTPENVAGDRIAVKRFAGRGGVSFSGSWRDQPVDLMVTPGDCSDGMSDRSYPFFVTLKIGGETRNGCAWSAAQPFSGPEAP